MKKFLNKGINFIFFYISIWIYIIPVIGLFLIFDYGYDFQINILDKETGLLRVFLIMWILFVHGVWLNVEFGEKIRKLFN